MDDKKGILIKVSPEFHKQIKLYTALQEVSIQNYIIRLILADMKIHSDKRNRRSNE